MRGDLRRSDRQLGRDRVAYCEQRINLLGWLRGTIVHMTYTERGDQPACERQRNVKSGATSKKLPASPKEWEAVIAAAPGKDRPLTPKEKAAWAKAVVVKEGGYPAIKAAKRKQGERGPTKQSVSIRYSPEVLDYFKATGAGWQTRMNDALRDWVAKHISR